MCKGSGVHNICSYKVLCQERHGSHPDQSVVPKSFQIMDSIGEQLKWLDFSSAPSINIHHIHYITAQSRNSNRQDTI